MGSWRRGAARLALLGLYLAVVLVSPLVHHDFECHQKTPAHCEACLANRPAPRVEPRFAMPPPSTPAVPQEAAAACAEPDSVPRPTVSSRAPPA
jgi:hypothetical protein